MNRIFLLGLAILFCLTPKPVPAAEILPLAGEWRFALDRADAGVNEKWFTNDLPDKIQLPGILQAQGYGDDITTNTPWVLTLGDAWWKIQPASLRKHFSQPGHVKVPFLAQPPKHYLGAAWYQRDIEIPTNWSGKHFTLFLERAHWQSTVWIDDQEFPANDSLSAPHITDLGVLTPGKHRLSIRVDNRTQLPAAGHLVDSHSISDGLGAAWNGIVGKIELQATPVNYVYDLEIYPHYGSKSAIIKGKWVGLLPSMSSPPITIQVTSKQTKQSVTFSDVFSKRLKALDAGLMSGDFELEMPLSGGGSIWYPFNNTNNSGMELPQGWNAELWDEFNPALYDVSVIFGNTNTVTFGLREISHNDKDILINGRLVNLRLTHDGGCFPLTGYPAMDVASWKKIIQTCKDYGLNGIRFHSWCPPEAAFEAADELGFYLQPECGLWADFGNAPTREFLEAETARIIRTYGNHPSFILLSPSNEPRNYTHYLPQWAATNYAKDNRRLYAVDSGWGDPSQLTGAQYAVVARFGNDLNLRNTTGWFGRDYRPALQDVHIPVLAHEVGQWCAYPDFDVIKTFTGYLQPGNYEIFKYIAEQEGVLDQDHAFAWASGRFQVACYKEEIEANLRTPGLAGFQLLDLHDYLGQGTALIGVLDAFWESKGYVTPDEFKHFCGPVVPLARLTKRVFTTTDSFEVPVEIANFGETALTNVEVSWKIASGDGIQNVVAQGILSTTEIPIGKNISLGNVSVELSKLQSPRANISLDSPKLQVPLKCKLVITGHSKIPRMAIYMPKLEIYFQNDWNFWLYRAQLDTATPSDVLVTHSWSEAAKRLATGGKVLFMPGATDLDPAKCPPMKNVPVFWNIQMTVRPPANPRPRFDAFLGLLCETNHPALAEFPTEANCDWQWTPLVNNVRSVNLEKAPRELKPIVWAIDDWNRNWKLGVIFECHVGAGKLLVSAINLDNERGGSGLQQLRRSLLDYMAGEKFQPVATLTPEQIDGLWAKGANSPTTEPVRAFDPDLNDGTIPAPKKP